MILNFKHGIITTLTLVQEYVSPDTTWELSAIFLATTLMSILWPMCPSQIRLFRSRRTVPVEERLVAALRHWRGQQAAEEGGSLTPPRPLPGEVIWDQ